MSEGSREGAAAAFRSAAATVTGNLYLVVATLVLATLALLLSWVPPRGNLFFLLARVWSRGLLVSAGIRWQTAREVPLDRHREYIFMANHRSLYDIPALIVTLPGQTRFLAKRSLFRIPIFGWALALAGFVNIDRQNLGRARDSFASAVARLRRGKSLLVFPEGTRATGAELLPFNRGGFLLALKTGMPIVPVGISGSGRTRRPGSLRIRPGVIRLHYGSPIEMEDFSVRDKQRLMREVRGRIDELRRGPAVAAGPPRQGRTARA